jgi:hypothetical protein
VRVGPISRHSPALQFSPHASSSRHFDPQVARELRLSDCLRVVLPVVDELDRDNL